MPNLFNLDPEKVKLLQQNPMFAPSGPDAPIPSQQQQQVMPTGNQPEQYDPVALQAKIYQKMMQSPAPGPNDDNQDTSDIGHVYSAKEEDEQPRKFKKLRNINE